MQVGVKSHWKITERLYGDAPGTAFEFRTPVV